MTEESAVGRGSPLGGPHSPFIRPSLAPAMIHACNPVLLGKALFHGERDAAILSLPITLDPATILAYNGLHLAISLAIGMIVMALVSQGECHPARAPAVVATIIAGFLVTIVAVGLLTTAIRPLLPWWSIVVANSLAVVAASGYLLRRHPGLWRRLMTPRSGRLSDHSRLIAGP